MKDRAFLVGVLVLLGAGWGVTLPLAKIAVGAGHRHFGIVFWQLAIGAVLLGAAVLVRGRGLPRGRAQIAACTVVALLGTVIPNVASYQAVVHLPAGIMSLVTSLVPMFAFPVALALGVDRFSAARLAGLALGLAGVAIIALPGTALPDAALAVFLPLALVAPLFYALEGNYVARWGMAGLDPVQLLFGASVAGLLITGPMAWITGSWISPLPPWGAGEAAILAAGAINAAVYAGYVWTVTRAGAVFAAQVSYLVTGFGVVWSMLLLGESYAAGVWIAMGLMFSGLFLVQPRAGLARPLALRDDAR